MLKSLSLPELVRSISQQETQKRDYLVDTDCMSIHTTPDGQSMLRLPTGKGTEDFALTETARTQISDRLEVPFRFFEHLRTDHPGILDNTVNTLFKYHNEPRFVRTLGADCRAILSPKYKVLDNYAFLGGCFLPLLAELPDAEVFETHLSQNHLHVSIILRRTLTEVKPNDIVRFGVQFGNSEVGLGSLFSAFFVHRLICSNGLISQEMGDNPLRKVHLGKRLSDLSLLSNEKETWRAYSDQVRNMANSDQFPKIASRMRLAADTMIKSSPAEAVEDVAKKYLLTKDESTDLLRRLIDSQDMSVWSMVNCVTELAKGAPTSQRKVELQTIGGKLLPMAA